MAIRTIIPTITSMATIITITTMPIRMSTTIPMAMITIMITLTTTTTSIIITCMRHRLPPCIKLESTASG